MPFAARRHVLQLNSEFENGAKHLVLREATDVAAQLLTDYLAGIEPDPRATPLLDVMT